VRPERDADPSPPSSAEVKRRVELPSVRAFVAYEKVKPTYFVRHLPHRSGELTTANCEIS
jgi:hypothetical protein